MVEGRFYIILYCIVYNYYTVTLILLLLYNAVIHCSLMRRTVESTQCRVISAHCRVEGVQYRVEGVQYRVEGVQYRVEGVQYRVQGVQRVYSTG